MTYQIIFKKLVDSEYEVFKDSYETVATAEADKVMLAANGFWFDLNGLRCGPPYEILIEENT